MTDHELDRRLTAAFEVKPSPDFLAHLRVVIVADPPPTRWRLSLSFAAPGAVLVVAAGIAVIVGWLAGEQTIPSPLPVSVSHNEPIQSVLAVEQHAVGSSASQPRVLGARPRVKSGVAPLATSSLPEVLISPDEVRGFGLLITSAQKATIPAVLPTDDVSTSETLTVPPIDITPVDIEPLPQMARLEQGDHPQ